MRTPSQRTSPWEASAAPTIPPISAWEAEEGIPRYQEKRFQAAALDSAANSTARPSAPWMGLMKSCPIVRATPSPRKAPSRVISVARAIATPGVRALDTMAVTMVCAESWRPLVKAKSRAARTTASRADSRSTGKCS